MLTIVLHLDLSQEIYKDRKKFSKAVFEVASSDLVNMGISVVSYTLKDIRDEEVSGTRAEGPGWFCHDIFPTVSVRSVTAYKSWCK